MDNVASPFGHSKRTHTYKGSNALLLPKTRIGLELEVENAAGRSLETDYWATKLDGSLSERGREYVLSAPLFGKDLVVALDELEAHVEANPRIQATNDTSLHVHIDFRGIDAKTFTSFILLYYIFEKVLFKYAGPERKDNIFCLSLEDTEPDMGTLAGMLSAIAVDHTDMFSSCVNSFPRYRGMNLNSLARFGSIEFRGHGMTYKKQEILDWINLLFCLKKAAKRLSTTQFFNKPYMYIKSEGLEIFTKDIFRKYTSLLNTYPGFYKDINSGVKLVRRLVNYNKSSTSLSALGATVKKINKKEATGVVGAAGDTSLSDGIQVRPTTVADEEIARLDGFTEAIQVAQERRRDQATWTGADSFTRTIERLIINGDDE